MSYRTVIFDDFGTINYRPDRKKKYTKNGIQNSKSNITKRAIVQLVEGDNIDFYNNI